MIINKKISVVFLLALSLNLDWQVFASDELVVGIFPRRNSGMTGHMFVPFVEYLSRETGIKMTMKTSKTYKRFWKNVKAKKYDIIHYNQLNYLQSKELGYEVFAKNEEFHKSTLSSAILVKRGNGINTIKDLKGKTIIFGGGKKAMVAYIGVKILLMQEGLYTRDYNEQIARNPPNSTFALYFNKADAAGVGDIALVVPLVRDKFDTSELKFISVGEPQGHLPWVMHNSIPSEKRNKIRSAFLSMNSSDEGGKLIRRAGLTNIVEASDEDYQSSRKIYLQYKELLKNSP